MLPVAELASKLHFTLSKHLLMLFGFKYLQNGNQFKKSKVREIKQLQLITQKSDGQTTQPSDVKV